MDQNVSRIDSGTIYRVPRTQKERDGNNGRKQRPFILDHEDAAPANPPDVQTHHEPLPVSGPDKNEAGGRIDLTA